MKTLFWHDYETSGTDPARDRPFQFAGLRTGPNLEPMGEPVGFYCQPDPLLLPHPVACLITGISPQRAQREGLPEPEFAARIAAELGVPGTCGVGYNSIRFDDEVTRYLLYRNFHDPYAREWRDGNSRWDIIDMLRVARALRPAGLVWPDHDDGSPSFRLEDLTAANGIDHGQAHDALADVQATLGLARLVRRHQPQLFAHLYELRRKKSVQALLDPVARRPVLHVSGRLPRDRCYTGLMLPLARHPSNANGVICFDLMGDAQALIQSDADRIRTRVFSAADALPPGCERLPLKVIHVNRCPVVLTPKLLDPATARRLHIDLEHCERQWRMLSGVDLEAKLAQVFAPAESAVRAEDAETALYAGFLADADRALLAKVRSASPEALAAQRIVFGDARYRELLFRYRARHYPQTLSALEAENWLEFCRWRLTDPQSGYLGLTAFCDELVRLDREVTDAGGRALLAELAAWAREVAERCGLEPSGGPAPVASSG